MKIAVNHLQRWLRRNPHRESAHLVIQANAHVQAIVVEPWGIEYSLTAGGRYQLITQADTTPRLEIEWLEKRLVVSVHGQHATFELQLGHRTVLDCPVATPVLSIEQTAA